VHLYYNLPIRELVTRTWSGMKAGIGGAISRLVNDMVLNRKVDFWSKKNGLRLPLKDSTEREPMLFHLPYRIEKATKRALHHRQSR